MFDKRPQVRQTGDASAVAGGVAISGSNHAPISVYAGAVPRSDYLAQVRQIAPQELLDRQAELDAMAAFFISPESGPGYLWWRAPAWAGKSALMAWFVLHPPAGVRVVSFFITSRFAGQSDRVAFCEVLLEQLAELLDEPLPPLLTEATRDAHLLGLLDRAAETCQQRGERLVLVVDGLDEDRGVTAGPEAHSIAALLPRRTTHGLRVIVAGRPNPPIPTDVPGIHPLRDQAIVRVLAPSPFASGVRTAAQHELRRLLHGSDTEQDLLGLLTAAGGGLSAADLSELTGLPLWEVNEHLSTVSGRTFNTRPGRWLPETTVYVLAHEELQQQAVNYLGPARLADYHQRLHTWAEGYRDRHWPTGTPEYLLRGYFRLLHDTGDLPRMIACALDRDRHDRMLDLSGGDATALNEIVSTSETVCQQDEPDLDTVVRLALHRDSLTERNARVPVGLPALWVRVGHVNRAEALATSIPHFSQRALAAAAEAMAAVGEVERAEKIAKAINKPDRRTAVAKAIAAAGEVERAEKIAKTVNSRRSQATALSEIARLAAAHGSVRCAKRLAQEAEEIAGLINSRGRRAEALVAAARAVATFGDVDRAERLLREAERLARATSNLDRQHAALADIAGEIASEGDSERAVQVAKTISSRARQAEALTAVAVATAGSGDIHRATAIAGAIGSRWRQAETLAAIAKVAASGGDAAHAAHLAQEASRCAMMITSDGLRAASLVAVAGAMAAAGNIDAAESIISNIRHRDRQVEAKGLVAAAAGARGDIKRAERIVRTIEDPGQRVDALTTVATAVADSGDVKHARQLAGTAEQSARSINDPVRQERVLSLMASALAIALDVGRAQRIAALLSDPVRRTAAMAAIAGALAANGQIDEAERMARSIGAPARRAEGLALVAQAVAAAGDARRAEEIARTLSDSDQRGAALTLVSAAVASGGDTTRAEAIAQSISNPGRRGDASAAVAVVVAREQAREGDIPRALETAREITRRKRQAEALTAVAEAVAASGDEERAAQIAETISEVNLRVQASALVAAIGGDATRAEAMTRAIPDQEKQTAALAHVAARVSGDTGRRLLAYAVHLGGWRACLLSLAKVEPATVFLLAGELLGTEDASQATR